MIHHILVSNCNKPHKCTKRQTTLDHPNRQRKDFLIKPQHVFMIKVLDTVGPEVIYLNIIKAIYKKPTPNSIKHGENLDAILLKSGMRQGCPLSPFS